MLEAVFKSRSVTGRPYNEKLMTQNISEVLQRRSVEDRTQNFLTYIDAGQQYSNLSFQDFYAQVCQTAWMLKEKYQVQPNDRIASLSYNHPDTVVLMFACWMVGACYVPVNVGEADERVRFILNGKGIKAVFCMPEVLERYESLLDPFASNPFLITLKHAVEGYDYIADMRAAYSSNAPELAVDAQELDALLVYTSGTTGAPKGVLLQQYNILVDCQNIVEWYKFDAQTRTMLVLPIHHVNGIIVTLMTPVLCGGSIVLNKKFSASTYWETLKEQNCTYGSVVPTILAFLNESQTEETPKAPADYFIICGAGPLTVETAKKFKETFGVRVNHGYGLSETTCYSSYLPFELSECEHAHWMEDYGYPSIGVALPCNEMDIHDASGNSLKAGEKGEIVIRGHNVMSGYDGRKDANEEAFANMWFRSGDEGFFEYDKQGRKFFFITGRMKELIIRGGVNYSPLEIDEQINLVPGVRAGVSVGFENDMYGEEIGAYVVLDEGSSLKEDDILESMMSMPFSKRPKKVIIGENLPVTSTGKYQRNKLKPLFKQWQQEQFSEKSM